MKILKISDYTKFPAFRHDTDNHIGASTIRKKFLHPLLRIEEVIQIDFDDTIGYSSSFLDELLLELIRDIHLNEFITFDKIKMLLSNLKSDDESIILECRKMFDGLL